MHLHSHPAIPSQGTHPEANFHNQHKLQYYWNTKILQTKHLSKELNKLWKPRKMQGCTTVLCKYKKEQGKPL